MPCTNSTILNLTSANVSDIQNASFLISKSTLSPNTQKITTENLITYLSSQGVVGPQGAQGIVGSTGLQGSQGVQGIIGSTGLQGAVGNTGLQGPQGVQGIIGSTGLQGAVGNTGLQGPQGVQGIIGSTGLQGAIGSQGVQGAIGSDISTITYFTPTTGGSINAVKGVNIIDPVGSLLSLTISMPAVPTNGDRVCFSVSQIISTFTISGGTIVGAITSTVVGSFSEFIYYSGNSKWYRKG